MGQGRVGQPLVTVAHTSQPQAGLEEELPAYPTVVVHAQVPVVFTRAASLGYCIT